MPNRAVNQAAQSSRLTAFITILVLALLACVGLAFTMAAIEIQSAVRSYVSSESLRSKGQQEAVYHLHRYAETGNPAYYRQAEQSLTVPLGGYHAHVALNEEPPDREAARKGLLQGGNHPEDIAGMIWLYLNFSGAPYMRQAIDLWEQGDGYIHRIQEIGRELDRELNSDNPSPVRIASLESELEQVNAEVRPIARKFSSVLGAGARTLRVILTASGLLMLVIFITGAAGIVFWALRSISNSERKFRAIFEQAAVGMAQLTPDGQFIEVNDSLCRILRTKRDELLACNLVDVTHDSSRELYDDNGSDTLSEAWQRNQSAERRMLRKDGDAVWCKLTFSVIEVHKGIKGNVIAIIEDISQARELSSELNYQANHDILTGLINRVAFEGHLRRVIHEAREFNRHHVLCFLDLDQFKIINDTCGHLAGDELLRQVADVLQQCLRHNDILARLGGDEFAIIFSQCKIENARQVADKLRLALADSTFAWEGATFNITASLGLVEINDEASEEFLLLRAADNACYAAKDQGRNAIHVYAEEDLVLAERRNEMEWVGRIREAVTNNRLQLAAQRIISLRDETGLRFEVLVRLLDSDNHLVMPDTFLPAAERYNVVTLIDRWTVNETLNALERHSQWLRDLEACHINLSAQSISRKEFLEFILHRLEQSDVPSEKLCFEITETAAISNLVEARKFIEALRERGCHFALDDFGSGLSSFGYLRSLPVDMIKIDGAFVRNLTKDEVHLAMVRSINEIGRLMNKLTVAEFVESHEILKVLRDLDIDFAQGYVIHKPCELSELLAQNRKEAFLSTLPNLDSIDSVR